ncbi:MAG: CoA pyrophosphatase [Planctomycetes bacterium]|nr:CoA pyrophosphatase [Planctomycetota bacterium]
MDLACTDENNITLEYIKQRLRDTPIRGPTAPLDGFRRAAVLIPLLCEKGKLSLLYIRRTETVQDHKGQVSFPGGAVEPEDNDIFATALRETWEEVGIPPEDINILGCMREYHTVSKFSIVPVVGVVPWPFQLKLSREEVNRAFTIPLSWLAVPTHRAERPYYRPDERVENVIYFEPFDGNLL